MRNPTDWLRLYALNYGWLAAAHKCAEKHLGTPEWFIGVVGDLMPRPAKVEMIYWRDGRHMAFNGANWYEPQ